MTRRVGEDNVSNDQQPTDSYDVAILGGGLAGLTLGLQLKQARPETSIFIAEKREGPAREAAFKVGESTQEISCEYFANVLGFKEHLEQEQITKNGLRFWFPAGDNSELAERVERGPARRLPVHTYQLDRGRFENFLGEQALAAGIDLVGSARVRGVELGGDEHEITYTLGGKESTDERKVKARWIVDASGRAFTLKRKLGLLEDNGHVINSSWFRLAGGLDLEDWADPNDEEFFGRMEERGVRKLSTNHVCGQGYWVWLIQLSSGPISIGLCADPRFHPFEEFDTLEGLMDWFRRNEPQIAESVEARGLDQVEDFLKVGDFSYGCKQVFSGSDRWALVGEAGAFLDPFYSPGSDFIAVSNTLTTDLVTRSLDGEDVTERAQAHDELYLAAYRTHLTFYEQQYEFWHNPAVMNVKIGANNIHYWGCNALLFFKRKWADLEFMARVRPDVERLWAITRRLEGMYREWHALESREWRRALVSTAGFPAMFERHEDLEREFDDDALAAQLAANADLMEAYAVLAFHKAALSLPDGGPGEDEKINPYAVGLDPDRWEADGLFNGEGLSLVEARQTPAAGMENLFMEAIATPA
ncbi:MAG TPA: FAD-dependent monooxygenase [Gaiellaceae bacterium]|nr:FAD-dependent monooxygenase [Gaiellaceae bacterium]